MALLAGHGHPQRGHRGDRRGARAALEQGTLAEDGAGPELGERAGRRRRPGRCRRARGRARRPASPCRVSSAPSGRLRISGRAPPRMMSSDSSPLQLALHGHDQRRPVVVRPRACAPRTSAPSSRPGRRARSSARPCPSARRPSAAGTRSPRRARPRSTRRPASSAASVVHTSGACQRTYGGCGTGRGSGIAVRPPTVCTNRTAPSSCTGSRRSTGSGAARKVAPILPTRTVVAPITSPLCSVDARQRRPARPRPRPRPEQVREPELVVPAQLVDSCGPLQRSGNGASQWESRRSIPVLSGPRKRVGRDPGHRRDGCREAHAPPRALPT